MRIGKKKRGTAIISLVMTLLMCIMLIPVTWNGMWKHEVRAKSETKAAATEAKEPAYINADFFNYDKTELNKANSDLKVKSGDKENLLFGNEGKAYYNKYVDQAHDHSAVLGIANDTIGALQPQFNHSTVQLFPNSDGEIAKNKYHVNRYFDKEKWEWVKAHDEYKSVMTADRGYMFPLRPTTENGVTYYQFNSSSDAVKLNNYVNSNGSKKLNLTNSSDGNFYPYYYNGHKETEDKYYFGTRFYTDFTMPYDGMINGKPVTFSFSGDDDVWVYIDGKLALDIGGVHGTCNGNINFATGLITVEKVRYNAKGTALNDIPMYWNLYGSDNLVNGKIDGHTVQKSLGVKRSNYDSHSFKMFYFERGANISNCKLRMNFCVLDKHKVSVQKIVHNKDNDKTKYEFKLTYTKNNKSYTETKTVEGQNVVTFDAELVQGEKYKVEEISTGPYTTTYKAGNKEGKGKVTPEMTISNENYVVFENSYIPDETVKVKKTTENSVSSKEYTFKLYVAEKNADYSKTPADTITVKSGEEKAFTTKVPYGYKYKVVEVIPSADADCTTTNKVDASKEKQGKTTEDVVADGKDSKVEFKNTYSDRSLTLKKTVSGSAKENEDYHFVVKLYNGDGTVYQGKYKLNNSAEKAYDSDGIKITLKANGTASITRLPYGIKYSVDEEYTDGYKKVDKTITVNGTPKKLGEKYAIDEKRTAADVVVNNDFEIVHDGQITVNKYLVANAKSNTPIADSLYDNTFIFKLENIDEKSPGYKMVSYGSIHLAKGSKEGTFTFGRLPVGTYRITELDHERYTPVDGTTRTVTLMKDHMKDSVTFKNYRLDKGYYTDTAAAVNTGKVSGLEVTYDEKTVLK
ncbi:hypothetical protein lbkm_0175 [Lachnospiraceae bacterium KM106-2]|nr:hypothetical protein lbkm_0175 [Lachnospiraceae bacterium KM106-2]